MKRYRIVSKEGNIKPIEGEIWDGAKAKLLESEGGIIEMQQATTRPEFEEGWVRFIDSLEEFWVRFFEEGKKAFNSFQPWAGHIIAERRSDTFAILSSSSPPKPARCNCYKLG